MAYPSFNSGDVLNASDMNAVGWWKVGSLTLTGTSTQIDNVFTDDYDVYRIVGTMRASANGNVGWFQLLNDSGTRLQTSYYSKIIGFDYGGNTTTITQDDSTSTGRIGWVPNSSSIDLAFSIDLVNTRSSSLTTTWHGTHVGLNSGSAYLGGSSMGARTTAEKNRGIYFSNTVSSSMSGTVRIYGYRN